MQSGIICLSTRDHAHAHAPQKVLAYAYSLHGLPSQPVCIQDHHHAGFVNQVCASLSQIQNGQS